MIGAATMEDVDACVLEDPWLIDLLRGRLINEENADEGPDVNTVLTHEYNG